MRQHYIQSGCAGIREVRYSPAQAQPAIQPASHYCYYYCVQDDEAAAGGLNMPENGTLLVRFILFHPPSICYTSTTPPVHGPSFSNTTNPYGCKLQ